MKTVQVLDKTFVEYIPYSEICNKVKAVAAKMESDLAGSNPLFIIMLNGAFMFAAELMKVYNAPAELSFIKYTSYDGTSSTGEVKQLLGLANDVEGRDVVIVEDIVESGLTMHCLLGLLRERKAKSVRLAVMLFKPNCLKYDDVHIDYPVFTISDEFIVGFGLDYNGYGRNFKDIYKIK